MHACVSIYCCSTAGNSSRAGNSGWFFGLLARLGWLASLASLGLAWLELARAGLGWLGPWLVWAGLAWFVRVWSPFDGSDLVQSGLVRLAGLLMTGLVWIGPVWSGETRLSTCR